MICLPWQYSSANCPTVSVLFLPLSTLLTLEDKKITLMGWGVGGYDRDMLNSIVACV